MRKIIIKLPDPRVKKFRLQREGWTSKRFLRASSLFNTLERGLCLKELEEKTAIVVKEYMDNHFEIANESLASKKKDYLLFVTICFLEDYLDYKYFTSKMKKYAEHGDNY